MKKNETKIIAEPGKQELFITREFEAPPEIVFKTFVDPKLFVRWLGPKTYKMTLHKFEPISGGSYRYSHSDPKGGEYAFHGVFHEVILNERITQTFEFEAWAGHITLDSMTFEALPGKRTKIVVHSVYQSVADRDGMVQSGMEKGVNDGYERLDEILATDFK